MDELLDLVNEKDEVIGEVLKSKANSDPKLIHREILVYIFDDENRMLMQQRSFNKKVYPGVWAESCAGHVGKGEDPENAAHRELVEELGFDTKLFFFVKRILRYSNETHISYCYLGVYSGQEIKFQKEEVEGVRFTREDEVDGLYLEKDKIIVEEIGWMKKVWNIAKK
ncbi:NUDIX domain-containing protein [Candidatus Shapirobacteria bacterium]|nr:NUDIX domain-containing protein [Candidatus Shapirobacteria bacterium]